MNKVFYSDFYNGGGSSSREIWKGGWSSSTTSDSDADKFFSDVNGFFDGRVKVRDAVQPIRYSQGWKDPSLDKKPPPKVARVMSQDYRTIKKQCLEQGALWEDPYFPADAASVFPTQRNYGASFQWKRPADLCKDPRMFVDGFGRFDVTQGNLGNCWFLAATASLCCTKDYQMFHQVVPADNLFVGQYAGVFHFNIWQYGKWLEVVVDDRLPTLNDRLVFVHSKTTNEFWPALLEKAYAKLNGSYEALQGGSVAEAMVDFTGGVVQTFNLNKSVPADLLRVVKKAFERDSLLGCSIDPAVVGGDIEGHLPNGLITGHAYSITGVKLCQVRGETVNLIRVRNPWGNEKEWKGAWSDRSSQWKLLSEAEKKDIDLTFEDDGEFWMTYEDFVRQFTTLEICMSQPPHANDSLLIDADGGVADDRRTPPFSGSGGSITAVKSDALSGECGPLTTGRRVGTVVKRKWEVVSHQGAWKRGVNAGGCRNYIETFANNPQYHVEVVDPDEDDNDNTGTLVVALMQKDRRKLLPTGQQEMLTIGYYIYKIQAKLDSSLDVNYFRYNLNSSKSPCFSNVREMVGRHKLAPGHYVVIPCTFKANQEGEFLLRIYGEKALPSDEVDEETKFVDIPDKKVKSDVPVFNGDKSGKKDEVKVLISAESEMKRIKTLVVTDDDVKEEGDIQTLFKEISGMDREVDPYELRNILDLKFKPEFKFKGFCLETARSMVALMDVDHSGKLGYEEFKKLWKDIRKWKKVFLQYDMASTSTLDSFELRSALNSSGFLVSNQTLKCLAMRYSDQSGLIYFDDFVHCVVRLKTMFAIYEELVKTNATGGGPVPITKDQFIQTTMYS